MLCKGMHSRNRSWAVTIFDICHTISHRLHLTPISGVWILGIWLATQLSNGIVDVQIMGLCYKIVAWNFLMMIQFTICPRWSRRQPIYWSSKYDSMTLYIGDLLIRIKKALWYTLICQIRIFMDSIYTVFTHLLWWPNKSPWPIWSY